MLSQRLRILAAATGVALLLGVGALLGRLGTPASSSAATTAIRMLGGIPVGVQDTPAGALAAADNYLALSSQTLEQNPPAFAALVDTVYMPSARAWTLAQATALRNADPANMSNYRAGGHAIALVAARRLDSYSVRTATITTWLEGIEWGPTLPPRQSWNLVQTALSWQDGRWLVASWNTMNLAAPTPSIVFVQGANNQSSAFQSRLSGLTAPYYGTGG
jgi:hypothetical protein